MRGKPAENERGGKWVEKVGGKDGWTSDGGRRVVEPTKGRVWPESRGERMGAKVGGPRRGAAA